jgi:hypothetical protein
VSAIIARDTFELCVQAGPELVLADPESRRVAHEHPQTLEYRLDPPLAIYLLDPLCHHRPYTGPALDETHALQLVVRLDDGVRRDGQLAR